MPPITVLLLLTHAAQQRLAWHALDLATALKNHGHRVTVFFYQDAVSIANAHQWQPQDESRLQQAWQQLAIDLPVCVSAALARGVTDADNAARHQLQGHNLAAGFRLTGLGELAELSLKAQRVVQL